MLYLYSSEVGGKMEKKKKMGEKVESKKINDTVKVKKRDKVVFTPSIKKYTRLIGLIMAFLASAASIFVFIFSIIVSLKVSESSQAELLRDNFSVTFISNLRGISINDTETLIGMSGNKTVFIILDIILPAIAFIAAMILVILLVKCVLDFIDNINTENELYCKDNIHLLEKMACYLISILTISLLIFDTPSLIIYALISLLVFVALGLFNKIVNMKNS